MYLKALEIQGFKSFPEKTRLTFEKSVTAIVGPNGSGKSNISDAIRWVMGEQSTRALRGGKMEDVIFGGTEKRRQLGFAEVSLILDNSGHTFALDASEVMVTRRYYRSGESEYYINRQSVRLRDINELFMDTGLGREGYSIIGQGRIDEILSTKSTDRREVFEAAAGISRFRHRKEEAEGKLQKAEENLLRVNDKISELEMQVGPLREQAETAKKYLILRDELRGIEISVWLTRLDELNQQAEKFRHDFESAKAELSDAQRELEELYAAAETFSQRMREKDVEAERVRSDISQEEAKAAEAESAAAVLRANLKNNLESIQRIDQELKRHDDRDSGLKTQIDERRARIEEIKTGEAGVLEDISALIDHAEELSKTQGDAAGELAELMRRDSEILSELSGERARLTAMASAMQELEDRGGAIIAELNEAEARLESARTEARKTEAELKKAREDLQSGHNVMAGLRLRAESRRKKAEAASDKKVKLTMELGALKSRIALLTEMEKEYQGYSKSVKIVMQESARGILKNVYGPVADLVKTEDVYTLAIETALGGAAQNIIVAAEEDGKAAISLLKRRDGGRATFLPISSIRGRLLSEKGVEKEAGFRGLAINLVRFDPKFEEIYKSILGRTVIAEDMDCAIGISRKYSNRFRIVTMDGQIINAGGSMTGGSAASNAGILSRANELKKLGENEKILSGDMEDAQREFENAQRELTAAEYELNVSGDEVRTLENSVLTLASAAEHHKALLAAIEDNCASLKKEAEGVRTGVEKYTANTADTRKRIEALETSADTLRAGIAEKSGGAEELSAQRQDIMDRLSELRSSSASLAAEREAVLRSVAELEALRDDLTGGKQQQTEVADNIRRRNEEILQSVSQKEKELSDMAARIAAHRERLEAISAEKLELEAERTRRDRLTQEKNKRLLDMERESARLEQKKLAADLEEKQIIDRLWDIYELSRTAAAEQRQELESVTAAQRRIGELRREISKLGNPNIGAIEEFERVNTRYTYLTDQRDDIEKAKSELDVIIGDITEEMREIFAREFKLIDECFRKTFTELFGGGRAALELEDPEDILSCGIEIKVQPPGKALKTITLLSGGEKAFVAIALYFAIIKVRPTPFVVMDEIEAALDEANVVRFAEYLRGISDKTQFVIITHRRGTMEEADVLYGVTMQERGVSQILNVDLEEAERTIGK